MADAELLAVACEIMRACGLTHNDVKARYSDRRLLTAVLQSIEVPETHLPIVFAAIDKVHREPKTDTMRQMTDAGLSNRQAFRVYESVFMTDADFMRVQYRTDERVIQHLDRLASYYALLTAHGVVDYARIDLSIVRGLAYYTGIVFELFDEQNEFRAICGGGRYDNLLSALGGVDMPALGFGLGDVVLGELLKARGKMPSGAPAIDYWVAPLDVSYRLCAVELSAALRSDGASVEYPLRDQTLAKQLKAANTVGARDVVIVGEGYRTSREVELKSLADGTQRTIAVDALRTLTREHSRHPPHRP